MLCVAPTAGWGAFKPPSARSPPDQSFFTVLEVRSSFPAALYSQFRACFNRLVRGSPSDPPPFTVLEMCLNLPADSFAVACVSFASCRWEYVSLATLSAARLLYTCVLPYLSA